ncbi:MAG: hypothetical protein JW811_08235 [Clostridiales bacterium]|nr:hypothetical protein [Clostridiales bacterium]
MVSHKHASFMSRVASRIGISPRLISILWLFAIALMFLALSLLYVPLIVLPAAFLAAFIADHRAWIKRRYLALKGRFRNTAGNNKRAV